MVSPFTSTFSCQRPLVCCPFPICFVSRKRNIKASGEQAGALIHYHRKRRPLTTHKQEQIESFIKNSLASIRHWQSDPFVVNMCHYVRPSNPVSLTLYVFVALT